MPAIRLGGDSRPWDDRAPGQTARLRSREVDIGGIETRAVSSRGEGAPTVLLHGWLDNADTWLAVLDRLAVGGRPAIAYDLPGFGTAPPLGPGSVLDQLVDFAASAVEAAADAAGRDVVVAGNSLGGWVALRLACERDLPLAGVIPIGPAGVRMAQAFFTLDRIPAVSRIIGLPAPVPPAVVRSVAGRLYRRLAFADPAGVDQVVVDRFTRFHVDRPVVRERIEYAKRLRDELDDPFDADAIEIPVHVIWGELDRLCPAEGAGQLAERLPAARITMLPGVGHTPQVETPDVVVEAIAELCG
jgi:pimeloyl-ACP methyl ester carboxylesterase